MPDPQTIHVVDVLPWERQPGEPDRGWDAFRHYRDLGPRLRSLSRLASDLLDEERVGGTSGGRREDRDVQRHLERLSSNWHWRERVIAYDMALDRRRQEEQASEIIAMDRRLAELSQALITAVAQPAIELLSRIREQRTSIRDMSDKELLSLSVQAGRIIPGLAAVERASRGKSEPIDVVHHHVGSSGLQSYEMSDDHLVAVWTALSEMGIRPQPPEQVDNGRPPEASPSE